jgi:hypothetical protein
VLGSGTFFGGVVQQYDVAPDGDRFLILTAGDAQPEPFNVVVDWTAALKK